MVLNYHITRKNRSLCISHARRFAIRLKSLALRQARTIRASGNRKAQKAAGNMPSGPPGENSLRDGNAAAAPDRLIQARASKDVKSKTLFHRAEQRGVLPVLHRSELSES